MKNRFEVNAVIWDYDGTLVDSGLKNLNVTRKIVNTVTEKTHKDFPAIQNLDNYLASHKMSVNWRDYYKKEFDIDEDQIDEAGRLWTDYQLNDNTKVPLYSEINNVIQNLSVFPQGIVSQNSYSIIYKSLKENKLLKYFESVIGYEEVELNRQKPEADGMLLCIKALTNNKQGIIYYIGDHETDVLCVKNTNKYFVQNKIDIKVKSIIILHNESKKTYGWKYQPDYAVSYPGKIYKIIKNNN